MHYAIDHPKTKRTPLEPARVSPLVQRVLDCLVEEIHSIPDGGNLLPEVELAEKYDVSRSTIRVAMAELEKRGRVQRVRGRGTFPVRGRRARALFRAQFPKLAAVSWFGVNASAASGYSSLIIKGAIEECLNQEHKLMLAGGPDRQARAESCYRLSCDNRVAGLLLISVTDQALLEGIAARGKPVVLVDCFARHAPMDCVRIDSAVGSAYAVEHLAQLGHRRIAFINSPEPEDDPARLAGYREGLRRHNLSLREEWVVEGPGEIAAMSLLRRPAPERPTAILASSNELALAAMNAVLRSGLRVPEDISIVGTGGITAPIAMGLPELTWIRFDNAELGRAAIAMLLRRIRNPGAVPRKAEMGGTLHLGHTTARARTA